MRYIRLAKNNRKSRWLAALIKVFLVLLLVIMFSGNVISVAAATSASYATATTIITNGTYVSDDGITKQTWTFSGTNEISMKMNYMFLNSSGTYRIEGNKLYITNTMFGSTATSVYDINNITADSFNLDGSVFKMSGSPTDPEPTTPEPDNPEPTTPDPKPENPTNPPENPTPKPVTPAPSTPAPAPVPNKPATNVFLMGEDDYNFKNNASSFGYGADPRISLARFQQVFTPAEAQKWFKIYYSLHGNCFGFSASSSLFNKMAMNPSNYQKSIDRTYRFSIPKNNAALKELIELYQISQSLAAVNSVERYTSNNYAGLISAMYKTDGSVNKTGLMIAVKKPTVGHSIIAYDITNAGNGLYYLSIYDNNDPNDASRKMTVDTAKKTWKYDSYSSASGHEFRYLDSSVAFAALQTALQEQGNPRLSSALPETDMYISVPIGSAEIFQEETPVSDIAEVLDVTPLTSEESQQSVWFAPIGIYTVRVLDSKKDNIVTMFDASSSFEAKVSEDAIINGTTGDDVFITVDTGGKLTVQYANNEIAENPVAISGKPDDHLTFAVSDGKMYISGNGKFKVSFDDRVGVYNLSGSEPTIIELSELKQGFPWLILAIGIIAVFSIAVILIAESRKK